MKVVFLIFVLTHFTLNSGFAQPENDRDTKNYSTRIGYGNSKAGRNDILGKHFFIGIQNNLWRKLNYELRLSGTYLNQVIHSQIIEENSNGVSFDFDAFYLIKYWRITFYPSAGGAIRFANEKYLTALSYGISSSGQFVDLEYTLHNENEFQFGLNIGFNLEIDITRKLILGARAAGQILTGGQEISFVGFTARFRDWKL